MNAFSLRPNKQPPEQQRLVIGASRIGIASLRYTVQQHQAINERYPTNSRLVIIVVVCYRLLRI